jgi:hypothetical protein
MSNSFLTVANAGYSACHQNRLRPESPGGRSKLLHAAPKVINGRKIVGPVQNETAEFGLMLTQLQGNVKEILA